MIFLAVLSLLSLGTMLSAKLFILITFFTLKYGYVILEHTAEGKLSPPTISAKALGKGNNLPLQQVVVFVLMFFIAGWAFTVSTVVGIIALLVILLSAPASVMVMALEKNILKAMNPLTLMGIISRVGGPYFILYGFLLLLSAGAGIAKGLLAPILPLGLLVIMGTFLSGYFTLIMFNMMGYIVYQYHEELGFDGVYEFEDSQETGNDKTDPFLSEINILIAEGMIDDAKKRLKRTLDESHLEVLDYHQRYFDLLLLSKDKKALGEHGEPYIKALIYSTQPDKTIGKAVDVYADCLKLKPDFYLSQGNDTYELAETANRKGKYDLALRMVNKFAQRYPDDLNEFPNAFGKQQKKKNPAIPKAYFLAAKILFERKHQDAQATKILTSLLRQFPTHPLIPEIKEYLGTIKQRAKL
jgi:tetratricopeptide (TPR) repeat protein